MAHSTGNLEQKVSGKTLLMVFGTAAAFILLPSLIKHWDELFVQKERPVRNIRGSPVNVISVGSPNRPDFRQFPVNQNWSDFIISVQPGTKAWIKPEESKYVRLSFLDGSPEATVNFGENPKLGIRSGDFRIKGPEGTVSVSTIPYTKEK